MTPPTANTTDHLQTWLTTRETVPWHDVHPVHQPTTAHPPIRDGAVHDILTTDHPRDPDRATRLLRALHQARTDAATHQPLTFTLLSTWQRIVLGTHEAPFRTTTAVAKNGRERYGLSPTTRAQFDVCLHEANHPHPNLAARAARAYLDVCFFHPFPDGNARAAFLTLTYLLARDHITLDQVGPIRRTQRHADSPHDALTLANLIATLIHHTQRRSLRQRQRGASMTEHATNDGP